MDNLYDSISSFHYLQYRPPLHELILQKCFPSEEFFDTGLDIGCGVGISSIALSKYCKKIIGIDPSQDMLNNAISHPKVNYQQLTSIDLEFGDQTFDVITFAGSLFYAKSQRLLDETLRISKNNSKVIVYDFEVKLAPILQQLTGAVGNNFAEDYNHEEDFSGLDQKGLLQQTSGKENRSLVLSTKNMVHLLLSSKEYYKLLSSKFGINQLQEKLQFALEESNNTLKHALDCCIYYSVYEIKKR